MPEKEVLEKLNLVSTAKRTANMVQVLTVMLHQFAPPNDCVSLQELRESDFGKRQEIHRLKRKLSSKSELPPDT